ncbi:DoxX family protein [Candidatus Venteria ishoeyi]|uniref:Uncharacterized protein n=1 Tax=Candidatus Venteria ishoeyi TaxID=1899563 RepID=A0A1H6FET2_9GAMM|nr:hypothetical protein [Candidatus Venteria ishoeyi]SEH08163.1 Uncharacterised protein [Candidatus Venteria ishoeyi]
MLDCKNTSLICPENDLESYTIIEIAKQYGIDTHIVAGDWGITLEQSLQKIEINTLNSQLLIIELPAENSTLETLSHAGKQVHLIDHHQYANEDNPVQASSLEQFAQKIGHTLTQKQWHIAINDRDYLPGLSAAGVSFSDMKALREQELEIQGKTALMQEARQVLSDYRREFDDLHLFHVPKKYAKVMLEAAQTPTEESYKKAAAGRMPVELPNILILYFGENKQDICQIEFAGNAKHRQWLTPLRQKSQYSQDFTLWQGGNQYGCFFGAIPKHTGSAVDALVDELLSHALQTGRPLRHYHCNFYLPLDIFLDEELATEKFDNPLPEPDAPDINYSQIQSATDKDKKDEQQDTDQQAWLYFLPQIRHFLIPHQQDTPTMQQQAIQHWRIFPQQMCLHLGHPTQSQPLTFAVSELSLYRYFNALHLLAIQVQMEDLPKNSSLCRDDQSWWHDLFYQDDISHLQKRQLAHCLRFSKLVRVIYPSFGEQLQEKKIDELRLEEAGNINIAFRFNDNADLLQNLGQYNRLLNIWLQKFFQPKSWRKIEKKLPQRLQQIRDDRMFINVAYGLSGQVPDTDYSKQQSLRLLGLAGYVDAVSDTWQKANDYAYDEQFTRQQIQQDSLQRWQDTGTYALCCNYANAHLGYGYFFNNVIAPIHIPHIYGRMAILALFYQKTLRHYNRRISFATDKLTEQEKSRQPYEGFRTLRQEFINFTNKYWFHEISSQIQGIELFNKQTTALGLEREYDLIKDEMERADEYSDMLQNRIFSKRSDIFTKAAGGFAIASVVAAVLALWPLNAYEFHVSLVVAALALIYFGSLFFKKDYS